MEVITLRDRESSAKSASFFARHRTLAFGVLVSVNAMWAFQFSGARIATSQLGGLLVTLLPLAIATVLILPFAKLNLSLFYAENRSSLIDVSLLGTLGVVPAQLFLVLGVERTLASNASVLALTVPVLTCLSAALFLHERMTRVRWLSLAVAVVGVCLISATDFRSSRLFDLEYVAGNLFVLASCAGSAFYNSFSRRALARLSPTQVLAWSFIVADVELLLLWTLTDLSGWRQLTHLGTSVWWSLVLVAIFSLALSMLLYFKVIQAIEVMRASLSIYLLPVFGLLFSGTLLSEKLTSPLLAGALMIFVSSFLVAVYEEQQQSRGEDSRV